MALLPLPVKLPSALALTLFSIFASDTAAPRPTRPAAPATVVTRAAPPAAPSPVKAVTSIFAAVTLACVSEASTVL